MAAFVLGTAAFLALASFLLVTILKGLMPSEKDASSDSGDESATTTPTTSRPARPPRKKRGAPPAAPAPAPAAEDE